MSAIARLESPDVAERLAAVEDLATRDAVEPEEIAALVARLGDASTAVQRRSADALAALAGRGMPVRGPLVAALAAAEPARRWGAAFALSRIGEAPAACVPILLDALGAPDGDRRWAAADLLARTVASGGVTSALEALAVSGTAPQRKMALYCLRDAGTWSPAAEARALGALADPDTGVRLAAMSALARRSVDRARAVPLILAALADPDAGVRRAAAAALGTLGQGSADVRAALETAAAATDGALRRAAERSLRLLADRR
jgi:hypothetical protein